MLQPLSALAVERPTNIIIHRETYYKDLNVSDMFGPMDLVGPKHESTPDWDLMHRLTRTRIT